MPLTHPMTTRHLAKLFNKEFHINAHLTIIKIKNCNPSITFHHTNLPFLLPSPNIPTLHTTFLYPPTALIQPTNLSQPTPTTKPFHLIPPPYINTTHLPQHLNHLKLKPLQFTPLSFTPT
ncbi:exo-beta-N-acetylmuramidase NamZ domain-containing protein, partial [Bacillus sp. WP8]|uniref:exo-beta-N-acetylmuramidase NamZ domain-containing protein n=1 Tax=Bacillus sp. WP8 TaxID=756828 RepID=UPI0021B2A43E